MGVRIGNRHSGLRSERRLDVPGLGTSSHRVDHRSQAAVVRTTRPRLGFLATPNLLLYGTAGVAYGQTKDTYTVNTAGVGTAAAASINDVTAGWTAGGGIEGAFGGGWSAKVEYLYIDLGKLEQTITVPPAAAAATFNSRLTDNIVRVGLNYKWGGY